MDLEDTAAAAGMPEGPAGQQTGQDFSWLGRLDLRLDMAHPAEPSLDDPLPSFPLLHLDDTPPDAGGSSPEAASLASAWEQPLWGSSSSGLGLASSPPGGGFLAVGPSTQQLRPLPDLGDVDSDPIGYLEAEIEADRPKYDAPSPELQAVLDAVAADAAQPGAAALLPSEAAAIAAVDAVLQGGQGEAGAEADAMAVEAEGRAPGATAGAAGGGGQGRGSPDIVLRGPGSSGNTSPGSERAVAQQGLLAPQQQQVEQVVDAPLWTLLEEPEEGEEEELAEGLGSPLGAQGLLGAGSMELLSGRTGPEHPVSAPSSDSTQSTTMAQLPEAAQPPAGDGSPPASPRGPRHSDISSSQTSAPAGSPSNGGSSESGSSEGGSGSREAEEGQGLEQRRRETFALLQPVCSVLLQRRADPGGLSQMLAGLAVLVSELDPRGLAGCLDYLFFPLLPALDSIAATRQPAQGQGAEATAEAAAAIPAMGSDQAAEAALSCLRAVLVRSGGCARGDQLLGLLQHLAAVAMLPPGRASEEVRLKVLRCVEAALPFQHEHNAADQAYAALREEEAAPLLGHLASLLLQQSAEGEVQAASGGSKAVRAAALSALRHLIAAVGSAEALAFFLPGIVTGLGKALAAAGTSAGPQAQSGAAASSTAAEEALSALTEVLVMTLGNDSTLSAWHGRCSSANGASSSGGSGSMGGGSVMGSWGDSSVGPGGTANGGRLDVTAAMEQLRQLSLRASSPSASASSGAQVPSPASTAQQDQQQQQQQQQTTAPSPVGEPAAGGGPPRLRVERSWAWVEGTAGRVHEVLRATLPPLCSHRRPSVRQKLAEVCATLLSRCALALAPATSQLLSETLFTLAQDEWPQVAEEARAWLQAGGEHMETAPESPRMALAPALPPATLERSLLRLAEELPGALRGGDQQGTLHARKLTTCIQICPPAWFAAHILGHPSRLATLFSALAQAFAFEREAAALLAHAPPEAGTAYQAGKLQLSAPVDGPRLGPQQHQLVQPVGSLDPSSGEETDSGSRAAAAAAAVMRAGGVVAVLLPRMPLGLALIHTSKAYQAVAGACRAAAAVAAAAAAGAGGGEGGESSAASGTALRRLLDHGIRQLQQLAEEGAAAGPGAGKAKVAASPSAVGAAAVAGGAEEESSEAAAQPWQLHAASVVAILSEMVFGASPAWQLGKGADSSAGAQQGGSGDDGSQESGDAAAEQQRSPSQELQSLVLALVESLVGDALWGLPTWQDTPSGAAAADSAGGRPPLTAQQLGVNVLATRAAVEAVGVCARALGPAFSRSGRLLRAALLPLLERLGDPAPLVASAAGAAIGSICLHCGYSSLNRLVGENADYVVDGVCAQLRQLERHPRAPHLLAVLMHKAGVAPELLPLLAEPARSAVQGVSILARRRQPGYVLSFLLALGEIMQGARACAELALREMRELAADVQTRWQERRREREAAAVEAAAATAATVAGNVGSGAGGEGREEVRDYFLHRARLKAAGLVEEGETGGEEVGRVPLSDDQRTVLLLCKRRLHAAASLAQTAVDCCGPLALSSSLQVAVQALAVCRAGLHCLKSTTLALELDQYQVEPYVRRRSDVAPPDPLTPKLLPSVHLLWSPLMGALKDWRVSLLEAALGTLCELGAIAGSFLARRFGQDAWPALQRLLREGPPGRQIIAPGQDELISPAAVQRVRCTVLSCLRSLAIDPGTGPAVAGSSGGGAEVVAALAGPMLAVVGEWLGERQAAVVRERATQAFMALAKLESDAAWTLLTTALRAHPGASALGAPLPLRCPDPSLFPPVSQLCPPPPSGAGVVPAGLRECGAGKLAAMLAQVEKMGVMWHEGTRTGSP